MMDTPMISVIVPFYNVEDYAARCLDSLLAQTYRSFEVVCIDDGSTDGTPAVLEDYSGDPHIRVFRVENGGQSAARNFGIGCARGELLTFVDSDDFVSPSYLEVLSSASEACAGGLVVSDFVSVPEDSERDVVMWPLDVSSALVGRSQLVEALLYDELPSAAFGKLAPKSLYERVPFPEGHVYEDVMMAMDLVSGSESFCVVDAPVYAYAMRSGSTVWDKCPSDSKINDYLAAAEMLPAKALAMYPEKTRAANYFRCLFYSRIHTSCLGSASVRAREVDDIVLRRLRKLLPGVARDPRVSTAQKTRFALCSYATRIYDVVYGAFVRTRKTGEER